LAIPVSSDADVASVALVFMLAVVLSAARFGRGPSVLAAGLSVVLLNLMFVPPRFSLAVADERFFFTFAVMLVVGLVVGQLTAGLKVRAREAIEREQRVRSLYDISRELGGALGPEQVAAAFKGFASAQLDCTAMLWAISSDDRLRAIACEPTAELDRLARWTVEHGRAAGPGTDSHAEQPFLLLPLRATMAVRGALAVHRPVPGDWSADEMRLLKTCATLLAGTLERIHYIDVAQATAMEVEGERLRNALLSALSHDLRTPLVVAGGFGRVAAADSTRPDGAASRDRRCHGSVCPADECVGQQLARHGTPAVRCRSARPAMATAGGSGGCGTVRHGSFDGTAPGGRPSCRRPALGSGGCGV
jgi:two-component system, OmpR family, sensor histidine kinase KdpD